MNLNFKEMSTEDLRAFVLNHRTDDEAFGEYRSRLKPSGSGYSFPKTEDGLKQMEEVFRQKLQEIENKQQSAG